MVQFAGITCKQEQTSEETEEKDPEVIFRVKNKLARQRKCKRPREAGPPKGLPPAFGFFMKEMWRHTRATCPAKFNSEFAKRFSAA
jgi:hypothetical protein